jgi:hypothetical protein
MKIATLLICLFVLASPLAATRQAQATLGEGPDSVTRDRHALSAAKGASTVHTSYTVQEVTSAATTVREYLNQSGVVFAVAWKGMVNPDLTTLLGAYAGEFQEAKQRNAGKHGQRQLRVKGSRVIVEIWGHMRNLQGRAYLPALLPEGVSVDEIN